MFLKCFMIFTMTCSSLAFLLSVNFIIGMSYRDRSDFKQAYQSALDLEIKNLLNGLKDGEERETFLKECRKWVEMELHKPSEMIDMDQGDYSTNECRARFS